MHSGYGEMERDFSKEKRNKGREKEEGRKRKKIQDSYTTKKVWASIICRILYAHNLYCE